jgi:hypothetical protein
MLVPSILLYYILFYSIIGPDGLLPNGRERLPVVVKSFINVLEKGLTNFCTKFACKTLQTTGSIGPD